MKVKATVLGLSAHHPLLMLHTHWYHMIWLSDLLTSFIRFVFSYMGPAVVQHSKTFRARPTLVDTMLSAEAQRQAWIEDKHNASSHCDNYVRWQWAYLLKGNYNTTRTSISLKGSALSLHPPPTMDVWPLLKKSRAIIVINSHSGNVEFGRCI